MSFLCAFFPVSVLCWGGLNLCVLCLQQTKQVRQTSSCRGNCSRFRRAGAVQCLPQAMSAKLRGNLQWPCAQAQTPAWADACGILKSPPQVSLLLPHECRAMAAFPLFAKPWGTFSFKRERCIHQDFTAEVPSLCPSPCAAQVACECWWHLNTLCCQCTCLGVHAAHAAHPGLEAQPAAAVV